MGKDWRKWTKKLKGKSQRERDERVVKAWERKQLLAKQEKAAHDAAVIEAMRRRCVRETNEAEIKWEKELVRKYGPTARY